MAGLLWPESTEAQARTNLRQLLHTLRAALPDAVGDEDAGHAMIADGLPPMLAHAIVAIFAAQRAGVMADTTDTVREVTGGEPLGIADFAREYAAAFRPIAAGSPG